jgi:probable F420-dependent oxidoreductase
MHPFRFAVMTNGAPSLTAGEPIDQFGTVRSSPTRKEIEATARKVEDLGYFAIHINDHYGGPGPAMEEANHAPQPVAAIPTVLVMADATTTLRVGFRVICVDYHNPTVLAKSLATLDLFTGGRIEVGLGAGWITSEYEAMGVPMDKPSVRIARLGEVVDILRASFAPGIVSVEGQHGVRCVGFDAVPDTVQQPSPPIAIGGGARRVLELAARKADIVCFNIDNRAGKFTAEGIQRSTADATLEKIGWIKEAAGDRFSQIELEIGAYYSAVTDDAYSAAEAMAPICGLEPDAVLEHPHALIGTVDAICDKLEERRERFGYNYITVLVDHIEAFAPIVERLSGK